MSERKRMTQDDFRDLEVVVTQCIGSGGRNYNTLHPGDVFYTCNCSLKCPYQVEREDLRPYCKAAVYETEVR